MAMAGWMAVIFSPPMNHTNEVNARHTSCQAEAGASAGRPGEAVVEATQRKLCNKGRQEPHQVS